MIFLKSRSYLVTTRARVFLRLLAVVTAAPPARLDRKVIRGPKAQPAHKVRKAHKAHKV